MLITQIGRRIIHAFLSSGGIFDPANGIAIFNKIEIPTKTHSKECKIAPIALQKSNKAFKSNNKAIF